MKLYFMPGACSLTAHIALVMTGHPFEIELVDYETRQTSDGRDFWEINPKGYVPALEADDGRILTEIPVILQYLDAQLPEAKLLPADFDLRLTAFEWLHFLATEVHKSFSPLFRPNTPSSFLSVRRGHLKKRLTVVETALQDDTFLLGNAFSVTDAYLFTLCRWLPDQDLDIGQWPTLDAHYKRVGEMPAVGAALFNEAVRLAKSPQKGGVRCAC